MPTTRKRRRSGWPAPQPREQDETVERSGTALRLDPVQAVASVAPLDVRAEVLLDRLYRAHSAGALRFALMLTGDRALSEDLVQEAFVRVASKLDNLRDPGAFNAYLTRAVANLAKSHFRRQQVAAKHTRRIDPSELVTEAVEVEDDSLLVALRRLPMQQRAAIVLRYYNDLSQEEIAQVLDCPVGTVKSQLSRGLARLRRDCQRV